MHLRMILSLASLALASMCFGCGDDDDGTNTTNNGTSFTASVTGPKAQQAANAYVIWNVATGDDYSYLLGRGQSSGGKATVSLSLSKDASGQVTMPDEALNVVGSRKAGVGIIALLDSSASALSDGKLTDDQGKGLEKLAVGLSARYALIYRSDDGSEGDTLKWVSKFPQGLSCGRCVTTPGNPDGTSNGFDTFEPVDCGSLEVETAADLDSLEFCNWT